jgi:hypothetical protein
MSDQPVSETSTCTGQHNIETQETNIHALSGIDPATPATKRPQTYALDRAVTEVGYVWSRNPEKGGQRSVLDYKRLWVGGWGEFKSPVTN